MTDLQFQEPQYGRPGGYGPKHSWLTGLIIKMGLASDDAGAQRALLIVLVLAIIGIVLFFILGSGGSTKPSDLNINGMPRV